MAKAVPGWFAKLSLREALLVWLAGAQSRYESALVDQFRTRWDSRSIREMLRALCYEHSIELDEIDRVRWRITLQGRNQAKRSREAAQKAAAA